MTSFPKPEKLSRRVKKRRATIRRKTAPPKYHQRAEEPKVDWETLRPEILLKGDSCCYLCGVRLDESNMTTEHMVIQKMGQKKNNDPNNLMPACWPCNDRKGSRRLTGQACSKCQHPYQIVGLPCLKCQRVRPETAYSSRVEV